MTQETKCTKCEEEGKGLALCIKHLNNVQSDNEALSARVKELEEENERLFLFVQASSHLVQMWERKMKSE